MFHVDGHMVEWLRVRLGVARADRLLHDALSGEAAAILKLERAAGVHASARSFDGVVTVSCRLAPGVFWRGDVLFVPMALPVVMASAAPGLPLSSLVAVSGIGDPLITDVVTHMAPSPPSSGVRGPPTTQIHLSSFRMSRDDLVLGRFSRRLTWLRRWSNWLHLVWHGQPVERLDMRMRNGLPEEVAMAVLLGSLLVVCMTLLAVMSMTGSFARSIMHLVTARHDRFLRNAPA